MGTGQIQKSQLRSLLPDRQMVEGESSPVVPGYIDVQAGELNLLQYWHTLVKRRWTVIVCAFIVTTMTTVATFRMTPQYMASGKIEVQRESSDPLGLKGVDQNTSGYDYDVTTTLDTQVKILQSNAIALQVGRKLQLDPSLGFAPPRSTGPDVVDNSDIEEELIARFKGGLQVRALPGTRIIEVVYTSPSARLSAEAANTLINTYIEQNFRTKFESTTQTSAWLQKQLADLQLKVESSQQKLVRYQRETGILGVDEKQNIITDKLDDINKELTAAESTRIQKQAMYEMAEAGNLTGAADPTSTVERLHNQVLDLKAQLAQLETNFGSSYPKVVELRNQLKEVENAASLEQQRQTSRLKQDYLAALNREKMLLKAFDSQKQLANELNQRSIEYSILKRDYDTNQQLYDGLLQRLKEASVSAGLRSNNIRVVDPARVPLAPAKPNIPRNIFIGFLFGVFGGVGLAFILEHVDNTVRTPEEVQSCCDLPSLAIIPVNKNAIASNGTSPLFTDTPEHGLIGPVTLLRPRSEVSESYRALRTSVMLSGIDSNPQIIMVTSPLPEEGKTTTSINIAVVIAQSTQRVLLIDADMRKPSVHSKFAIENTSGLSNVLSGGLKLDSAVRDYPQVSNLSVLTSGPLPPHPAEMLASRAMAELIDSCREKFDYVVLDTPPVLSVTDAVVLSVQADATVLVIRSGQTTRQALRRARDLLSRVRAKVAGVVVNAFDINAPDNYYYYSYHGYTDAKQYYGQEKEE